MKDKSIQILLLSVCLTLTLFSSAIINAQNKRGIGVKIKGENGQINEVQLYDGSYALIIGNSDYSKGWDRLSGVKADVIAVRNILERHGFKVETEANLTSVRFETRIRKFVNDYGYDRNNRLIIYYAGHGYTLKSAGDKRELGYIIPSDTPLPTKDARGFRQKAIDMYAMQTFAKQIQAKHALFIFDSCFSGKLFALRNTLKISPFIYDKVNYPVRQFITAGDETQTVPDESVFRKAFVRGLEGDADSNNDNYITTIELSLYLKEKVTNYTNGKQTPQYGTIKDFDLDRGDFVFISPRKTITQNTVAVIPRSLKEKTPPSLKPVKENRNTNSSSSTPKVGKTIVNSSGIEFVWIPAGEIVLTDGSKINNVEGFWMGKTEITQGQWTNLMRTTIYQQFEKNVNDKLSLKYRNIRSVGENQPMYFVNWFDAQDYIKKLNKLDETLEYYLPNREEWEYAARAGNTGRSHSRVTNKISWNEDNSGFSGNRSSILMSQELYGRNPTFETSKPLREFKIKFSSRNRRDKSGTGEVAQKLPNAFGLYDIFGNLNEWGSLIETYSFVSKKTNNSIKTYSVSKKTQPQSDVAPIRGGAWNGYIFSYDFRFSEKISSRTNYIGFRLIARPK